MKKLLAVILALAMLVSVCSFAANAALPPESYNSAVYFVDTQNWGQVLMYAWDSEGSSLTGEWPGVQLEQIGQNETGQPTYVLNLPYGTAGIVLNDGNGTQTVDVTDLNYDTYYLDGTKDDQDHFYVSHIEYTTETTEPVTGTEPVKEYERKDKIYLTNNFNWQECYLYAWDENGDDILGVWPGTKITETTTNGYGEKIFIFSFPDNAAGIIINNGNGMQTEDITEFRCIGYWMDGEVDSLGHYIVTPVTYDPDETTNPSESQPTTAPAPDSAYYFYNTLDFENVYVYAFDAQDNALCGEWLGTLAEKVGTDPKTGDDKYLINIPAGTKGIVISDGNGHQTEDITDFTVNSYWLDGSKNDLGYYLVSPSPGYIEPTGEPGKYKLGDVNGDDIISVSDATLVQQQAAELIDLEGSALAAADTNHDGIVTVADATLIQQYAAEMIDEF